MKCVINHKVANKRCANKSVCCFEPKSVWSHPVQQTSFTVGVLKCKRVKSFCLYVQLGNLMKHN